MAVNHGVEGTSADLKSVFNAIDEHSCPQTYNFHLHTLCSDGRLLPEAVMQQASALGLRDLAITDHHTVNGYRVARQWLNHWHAQEGADSPLPNLWTGVEITALLLGVNVHILGYAFDLDHPNLHPYLQGHTVAGKESHAASVIEAIQAAGGLAVLAHPARYRRSPAALIDAAVNLGIDGIETFYCYANSDPWQPSSMQTQEVQQLGQDYGLLQTCGTDTHGLDIRKRI